MSRECLNRIVICMLLIFTGMPAGSAEAPGAIYASRRAMVIAEQARNRIIIVDSLSGQTMWEWSARQSDLPAEHRAWFDAPDEAKPVYGRRYILLTASGGGAALVRIADKKVMFYAFPSGNPHSAEILPDGHIVTASSHGNSMKVYSVDTLRPYAAEPVVSYYLRDGHNVVWDRRNKLLWATAHDKMLSFEYKNRDGNPRLIRRDSIQMPDGWGHDLFPVYGEKNKLWVSLAKTIYIFDIKTRTFTEAAFSMGSIKSVSSGPAGFGILLLRPSNSDGWSSDHVINSQGERAYHSDGARIYKARWFLDNDFGYGKRTVFRQP